MPGVTDTQLLQADAALGVRLPPDHRDFLRAQDGHVVSDEHVHLKVFPLAEMLFPHLPHPDPDRRLPLELVRRVGPERISSAQPTGTPSGWPRR